MTQKSNLKAYQTRRNFKQTPEPKGKIKKITSTKLKFVIQKHRARSLHYDVRLEIDGVLVSWAVPKGPSLNPREKRLAIRTENHPLEYARFEGVIPKGEYGAGPVMIWDRGAYKNIKQKNGLLISMRTCLKNGQIEVFLYGKKLKGAFALIKTCNKESDQWLLIKMRDEHANARRNPVNTMNKSVKSGLTMDQIKKRYQRT